MKIKCIIVDDEEIARLRLHKLLSDFEEIDVVGEAENGLIAVDKITQFDPDVVFLDIQMPGLNGFEVLKKLKNQPYIIFTTAFDEFAIQAFEENTIGYLLKPIDKQKLMSAIEKTKTQFNKNHTHLYDKLSSFIESKQIKQFISKLGSKIRFIPVEDVCYITSKDKSTFIHLFNGSEHIIDQTLQELEHTLDDSFIRVHRGAIVLEKAIVEAERIGEGKYLFTLSDSKKSQIQSSSSYTKTIKNKLGL